MAVSLFDDLVYDVVISDVRTLSDVICETYVNSGVVMMISMAL
jgi:hypothetical protein